MISIGVFEPKVRTNKPEIADLVCLKAFVDSSHNREFRPQIIDPSELEKIGYALQISAKSEIEPGPMEIFNQGIPRGQGTTSALIAKIEPDENGGYNLTMNFRDGTDPAKEVNERSAHVEIPGAGTLVLANGMIASWSTAPKN